MRPTKSDAEIVSPIKFGKLTFYTPPKVLLSFEDFNTYNKAIGDQMGGRTRVYQTVISSDETHMKANGTMVISSSYMNMFAAVKVTIVAFKQLLHVLRIPYDFAQRMPSDILVSLINRMLGAAYLKKIQVRLSPDRDLIIGFMEYTKAMRNDDDPNMRNRVSYYFLSHIATESEPPLLPSRIQVDQNVTRAIFLAAGPIADKHNFTKSTMLKPIVEVVHSDSGLMNPCVTLGANLSYASPDKFLNLYALYRDRKVRIDSWEPSDAVKAIDTLFSQWNGTPNIISMQTLFETRIARKILGSKYEYIMTKESNQVLLTMLLRLQDDAYKTSSVLEKRDLALIIGDLIRLATRATNGLVSFAGLAAK